MHWLLPNPLQQLQSGQCCTKQLVASPALSQMSEDRPHDWSMHIVLKTLLQEEPHAAAARPQAGVQAAVPGQDDLQRSGFSAVSLVPELLPRQSLGQAQARSGQVSLCLSGHACLTLEMHFLLVARGCKSCWTSLVSFLLMPLSALRVLTWCTWLCQPCSDWECCGSHTFRVLQTPAKFGQQSHQQNTELVYHRGCTRSWHLL